MATPINSEIEDIKNLRYQSEYKAFVCWFALPASERNPKTQGLLAKKFGIHQDTLSDWKNRPEFFKLVRAERTNWGREKTPQVIEALYKQVLKTGDAPRVRLWLEWTEGFGEKKESPAYQFDIQALRKKYA